MIGRELSNRTYPEVGVPDAHHMLSHHGYDSDKIVKLQRINQFHIQQLAYQLERLQATRDGDGTLLDNTLVYAHSEHDTAQFHSIDRIPIMTAGRAGGRMRSGLHLDGKDQPATQVGLTLMKAMGVNERD